MRMFLNVLICLAFQPFLLTDASKAQQSADATSPDVLVYTGHMLNMPLSSVINEISGLSLDAQQAGSTCSTSTTVQYQFVATDMGVQITSNYANYGTTSQIPTETVSFNWKDIDPTSVKVLSLADDSNACNDPEPKLTLGNFTGLSTIDAKIPTYQWADVGTIQGVDQTLNQTAFYDIGSPSSVSHLADLIVTAVKLSQGSKFSSPSSHSGFSGGHVLTETVSTNPLGDGTSLVHIRNNTKRSIYLTASTESCINLEITQCGPQLNHVRVAPYSTVHFWIDRNDDTQPWSYTVSCMVNGAQSLDCATGGGGGPKGSSPAASDDQTAPTEGNLAGEIPTGSSQGTDNSGQ